MKMECYWCHHIVDGDLPMVCDGCGRLLSQLLQTTQDVICFALEETIKKEMDAACIDDAKVQDALEIASYYIASNPVDA